MRRSTPAAPKHPKHGTILGFYAVIYDAHVKQELLIPIRRTDLLKGTIKLP